MCLHPFRAFLTGAFTEEGRPVWYVDFTGRMPWITSKDCEKRGLDHNLTPSQKVEDFIEIPCGTCPGCKKSKAYQWALRCQAEASLHKYNYFVTLTYDDAHCPPRLVKKDLQDYHKRLRKLIGPFRFFACGEYGSTTHRPHYHEILFLDKPITDLVLHTQNGEILYFNSLIFDKAWKQGFSLISDSNMNTSLYVSSYLNKGKVFGDEFILMSRRPGLGGPRYDAALDGKCSLVVNAGIGRVVRCYYPRYFLAKHQLGKTLAETLEAASTAHRLAEAEALAAGYDPKDQRQLDDFREVADHLTRHPLAKRH